MNDRDDLKIHGWWWTGFTNSELSMVVFWYYSTYDHYFLLTVLIVSRKGEHSRRPDRWSPSLNVGCVGVCRFHWIRSHWSKGRKPGSTNGNISSWIDSFKIDYPRRFGRDDEDFLLKEKLHAHTSIIQGGASTFSRLTFPLISIFEGLLCPISAYSQCSSGWLHVERSYPPVLQSSRH